MPLTVSNSFSGVRSISGGVLSRLFPTVLAARPLRAGGEPLRRATPARLSGAPEKELLTL